MRSIVREEASQVGLLLFDEPSASLDPAAEHGTLLARHSMGLPLICAFALQTSSTACGP